MNENDNQKNGKVSPLEIKEFKLLLNLLEKAEQILSIINLPESSISKYNTLKKMTYDMLNIEFKPLEKKHISLPNSEKVNNKNYNDDILYILYFLNIKKSMLIDLILNFITNNISNNSIEPQQNLNYYLNSLTDIYNLSSDTISSKSPNDIIYETKSEESKISGLFTKIDQIFIDNFEKIKQLKFNDNEFLRLRDNYNRDLCELKNLVQKNSILESELFRIRNDNEKNDCYLNKISSLINEFYDKLNRNIPNNKNERNIEYKYGNFDEDIMKLEYIKMACDKLFDDNNIYLNNGINDYKNNQKNYFDSNINKNGLKEIYDFLPEIQKESDIFHKNFNDLMNYIETNIEGKVI